METQQPAPDQSAAKIEKLIKSIRSVELFDKRRYRFVFTDDTKRYITSVTTKLEEYHEEGVDRLRGRVGDAEADRMMEEGGEWGSIVHHGCFLLATGGAVLYEPPAYQTVGLQNEEVLSLLKQNELFRQQFAIRGIPHLTITDQFRYLQTRKFKRWLDVVKPEILYAEARVWDLDLDIAGRLDFLMRVEGGEYPIAGERPVWLPSGIILPDVKAGAWSKKHFLQMAAYRKAVQKSLGLEVAATVGIHLKATTTTGMNTLVHLAEEADQDFALYQHVAAIYDDKHRNDVVEDFEFESVILSDKARDNVILGITIPNAASEAQIGAALVEQANATGGGNAELQAMFARDLKKATEPEVPKSKVITDEGLIRRKKP